MRTIAAITAAAWIGAEGARVGRSCGIKGSGFGSQIVNGENAKECEWSWQVGLWSSWGRKPFCGGMILSKDWILTAAHCVSNGKPNFLVKAGDHDVRKTGKYEQSIQAKKVYVNPKYNSRTMVWDFALVELQSGFDMSSSCVGPVCLPSSDVAPGTKCWITGWGTLKSGGSQPDVLQQAAVNIIDNAKCDSMYQPRAKITADMLCAQGNNGGKVTDACQGDSGGPLVCQGKGGAWELHGATSWGFGCASPQYPGVWARVTAAKSWIGGIMK